jgi:hypothetical protein
MLGSEMMAKMASGVASMTRDTETRRSLLMRTPQRRA